MVGPLIVGLELGFQKIREEKYPENNKNDDQFDDDNCPKFLAKGHAFETLEVKLTDFVKKLIHAFKLFAESCQGCYRAKSSAGIQWSLMAALMSTFPRLVVVMRTATFTTIHKGT